MRVGVPIVIGRRTGEGRGKSKEYRAKGIELRAVSREGRGKNFEFRISSSLLKNCIAYENREV